MYEIFLKLLGSSLQSSKRSQYGKSKMANMTSAGNKQKKNKKKLKILKSSIWTSFYIMLFKILSLKKLKGPGNLFFLANLSLKNAYFLKIIFHQNCNQ